MKKICTISLTFMIALLVLCSGSYGTTITIQALGTNVFSPNNVTATVGDTIHFQWVGGNHNTTCDGTFGTSLPSGATSWSSPLNSGSTFFDYILMVPGAYNYVCTIHWPSMAGIINALPPPPVFVDVTFRVDMSQTTIGPGGPHLVGDFNNWDSTATPMMLAGSYYEATVSLDTSLTYNYLFLNDSTYDTKENLSGATCAVMDSTGAYFRHIDMPQADSTLDPVCYGSCSACVVIVPVFVDVTFRVDMSQTTIGPGGPHLVGDFNNWDSTATPMSLAGSYYEATVSLDTSLTYRYLFLNDSTYDTPENLSGATCAVMDTAGAYFRHIDMPQADSTLDPVCYGSCSACVSPVYITVSVDMVNEIIGPGGVHLAGTFNGFSATAMPMINSVGSVYEGTVALLPGDTVQYIFLKDTLITEHETVPAACGVLNGVDYYRQIAVPPNDSAYPTDCYSGCGVCPPIVGITLKVNMAQTPAGTNGVYVAGSFNNFNPAANPLTLAAGSVYKTKIFVPAGTVVNYIFVNDSVNAAREIVPSSCGVLDGSGGYVRSITAPSNDTILTPVCFGSCANCSGPDSVDVIFSVDMTNETIGAGGVYLAGSFNGFDPTSIPMDSMGAGIYQATVRLDTTIAVQYIFLKDSMLSSQETVPAGCRVFNNGAYYRQVDVPENDSTLETVCFSSCAACVPIEVNVTFRVDLTLETPCGAAFAPYLTGSFNNFDSTATPMLPAGGGIYEVTLLLDTGSTVQYRFLKDSTFSCGDETVPASCGVADTAGIFSRKFTVGTSDTILMPVCFSSCSPCVIIPAMVNVTFRVDLSNETPCGAALAPYLAGSFNNFDSTAAPMQPAGAGVYTVTLLLDTGSTFQYRFLKDSTFSCGEEMVPSICGVPDTTGIYNRELTVGTSDSILDLVCFGSCYPCPGLPAMVNVTFRVNLSNESPCGAAFAPYLTGSFNNFDSTATPMQPAGPGIYTVTLLLDTGTTIMYRFLKDSTFSCGDEMVPSACGVADSAGIFSRVLPVGTSDTILPLVCFSSCLACPPPPVVNVTFRVDMFLTPLGPGGPHIAGTFNGFLANITPMINTGGTVYASTVVLNIGDSIQYTFLKDSTYTGQETIPSTCGVTNGTGGFNRYILVPATDTVLPAFCYSSCFVCNVGIDDFDAAGNIFIYPNPTEDNINIRLATVHDDCELKLYSMDGRLLYSRNVESSYHQTISVEMKDYAKGIYMLEVASAKKTAIAKVILK